MRGAITSTVRRVRLALAWRLRRRLGDGRVDRAIVYLAARWRPVLRKPVFIGIAGSAGKTTAKELLLSLLAHKRQGIGTVASLNAVPEVAKTILRLRPAHDFCIAELSEDSPGEMDKALALLRPGIGIVTVVGDDHWSSYGSRDAIAAEIGKLVGALPASGTAVLNFDDERVRTMATHCAAKVISYGMSPTAELRAENISAAWPDRLQLTLVHGAQRVDLRTQLCGSQWIPSILGAVGGGLATGLSLIECAQGIARVAPFDGRMQPVTTPEGVTFIRDDFKAPLWTLDACFEFMKAARAKRKIIVIGTLSAYGTSIEKKYARIARRAQESADVTIFVGAWASHVLKTRSPGGQGVLRAFNHVWNAADYVNSISRDGDLVLLKGTNKQDHLLRIILARDNTIACWRDDCDRESFCVDCPHRTKPSGAVIEMKSVPPSSATPRVATSLHSPVDPREQVIVGLGNQEPKYAGTPHNVGHEVVDRIAASLGLAWTTTPDACIARGSSRAHAVCLVKIRSSMNQSGAGLRQLSEALSFKPEQCVLVYDDLDTPIGSIRTRLTGGAGGHRGVASILEAFQSDAFRRVKVGVGQPGVIPDRVQYVLTPFDPASRAAVEPAISAAEARALEMVERHSVVEMP